MIEPRAQRRSFVLRLTPNSLSQEALHTEDRIQTKEKDLQLLVESI